MAPVKFIAVPVGTATGVEWRGVVARHGDQGYKIFWCASALAEMAAKAAAGGRIVYPSGLPKTPTDLCGELGLRRRGLRSTYSLPWSGWGRVTQTQKQGPGSVPLQCLPEHWSGRIQQLNLCQSLLSHIKAAENRCLAAH